MPILLAMSGGIDSTAAALLLQEQGYNLIGCTFRTRYTSEDSLRSAQDLAQSLGIAHHIIDLDEDFERDIVGYFRSEYMAGRTPNPCVVCNRCIKFGRLLDEAHRLGCDRIATGHYARIVSNERGLFLARAKDVHKDQTYFLWQLTEEQLRQVIFPLGDLTKQEVRDYLAAKGYTELAHKSESQDICFIKDDYRTFLNLPMQPGNYINQSGQVVGQHTGYTNYTIGQRKGLGIALGKPAFVTAIDAVYNEVRVGDYEDLLRKEVRFSHCLFRGDVSRPVMAQIRYRSKPTAATLSPLPNPTSPSHGGSLGVSPLSTFPTSPSHGGGLGVSLVSFPSPVWAVTPGQSVVLYQDDLLVGGGIIES